MVDGVEIAFGKATWLNSYNFSVDRLGRGFDDCYPTAYAFGFYSKPLATRLNFAQEVACDPVNRLVTPDSITMGG